MNIFSWWRAPVCREIDALIAKNLATYRPGMDTPDRDVLARRSAEKWKATLAARRRLERAETK